MELGASCGVFLDRLKSLVEYSQALIYVSSEVDYRLAFQHLPFSYVKSTISHNRFFMFWGDFIYFENNEEFETAVGLKDKYVAIYKLEGVGFLILSRNEEPFSSQEMLRARSIIQDLRFALEKDLLKESKEKLEEDYGSLLLLVPTGIVAYDKNTKTLKLLNDQAKRIFGVNVGRLSLKEPAYLSILKIVEKLESELRQKNSAYLETKMAKTPSPVWLEIRAKDTKDNLIMVVNDITYRKELERRINNLAFYDQDSKIPNKNYFNTYLSKVTRASLAFIYVLNWEELIRLIGYLRLNRLISRLYSDLHQVLSEYGMLFRLSESTLILALKDEGYVGRVSEIVKGINKTSIKEDTLNIKVSLGGIVLKFPEEAENIEELAILSSITLAYLKKSGIEGITSLEQLGFIKDVLLLLKKIPDFLESLALVFQPIHSAEDYSVIGAETLVSVKLSNGKLLSLGPIFEILEDEGFIIELDGIIWDKFLEAYKKQLKGLGLSYNFNVSPPGLVNEHFIGKLLEGSRYMVEEREICLEITERSKVTENEEALKNIEKLRSFGYAMAIDDFGAESASLEYIRFIQVDKVKLDGEIVKDVETNKKTQLLVSAVCAMAEIISVDVGAEFVERASQAEVLKKLGCSFFQGFLFSKPMEVEDFISFVRSKS